MTTRSIRGLAACLLLPLALAACGGDDGGDASTASTETTAAQDPDREVESETAAICDLPPETSLTDLLDGPVEKVEGTTYADGAQVCVWQSEARAAYAQAIQNEVEWPPLPSLPEEGGCSTNGSGSGWQVKVGLRFFGDAATGTLLMCEAVMDPILDSLMDG